MLGNKLKGAFLTMDKKLGVLTVVPAAAFAMAIWWPCLFNCD